MSKVFETHNYLLALKAGEVKVLFTQSIDAPEPITKLPIYRQTYNAIKVLNYNQRGKFNLALRTSRDGTKLAAVCTYDGKKRAGIPDEFKRSYRRRAAPAAKTTVVSTALPLSHFMRAHHEGRPVEVFVNKIWRPVEPADWTHVSPDNFRVRKRKVAVFWDDPDDRGYEYDPDERQLEHLRTAWTHVCIFSEEE